MTAFPSRARVPYGDVAGYAEIVRPYITPWYKGVIYIFNPEQNTRVTDMEAGTKTITVHPYYHSTARIQPLRTNLNSKQTTNDTTTRRVQFQTGYAKDGAMPDVRPGHQIIVANGGNNQLLTQYQYVITGTVNATGAFQHTIFTEVNLEAKPNYLIGDPLFPSLSLFPDPDLFPNG